MVLTILQVPLARETRGLGMVELWLKQTKIRMKGELQTRIGNYGCSVTCTLWMSYEQDQVSEWL
jgi:hypothetical protein